VFPHLLPRGAENRIADRALDPAVELMAYSPGGRPRPTGEENLDRIFSVGNLHFLLFSPEAIRLYVIADYFLITGRLVNQRGMVDNNVRGE